jgi:hypothetical protein
MRNCVFAAWLRYCETRPDALAPSGLGMPIFRVFLADGGQFSDARGGLAAGLKSGPSLVVALAESSEGWGCGVPLFAKCAKKWGSLVRGGVGLQQVPHRAFGPVRNDKIYYGLAARLKSCPSRAWCFSNPQRDGVVESHPSQSARRMGQPSFVVASAKQRVPHRAFSPVRNDKLLWGRPTR